MRYWLLICVLIFTLGFGAQALADTQNSASTDSQLVVEQVEFSALEAFETNDLGLDKWGVYDEDFVWETEVDWYDDWYGEASNYWEDYEYWGFDDPGESGWYDW